MTPLGKHADFWGPATLQPPDVPSLHDGPGRATAGSKASASWAMHLFEVKLLMSSIACIGHQFLSIIRPTKINWPIQSLNLSCAPGYKFQPPIQLDSATMTQPMSVLKLLAIPYGIKSARDDVDRQNLPGEHQKKLTSDLARTSARVSHRSALNLYK